MDHNRCHLVGRLAKNPLFVDAGHKGEAHCTFTLAVNRVVPTEGGPAADFIQCSLWGEDAYHFVESRSVGDEVGVFGRIRTGFVQKTDGRRDFFCEVRVEEVKYGRRSLKNLQPRPKTDGATKAVKQLTAEFKGHGSG